jgi:8-oxo-dGTP pyrophosphatase MutT (NUDIX family)
LRELAEETGIQISEAEKIGEYFSATEYKRDTVHVFAATVGHRITPTIDGVEIQQAAWFPLSELPIDRAASVDRLIAMIVALT